MGRSTFNPIGYHLVRFSPVLAFLLFGTFPDWVTSLELNNPATAFVVLVVVLLVWSMAEGTILLWHKARSAQPGSEHASKASGYLIVAIIIGLILLPLLQVFRGRVTQQLFIALLIALSLRGASRTSWQQGRTLIGSITSPLAAAAISALTFAIFRQHTSAPVPWQAVLIALSFGAVVLAADTAWHSIQEPSPPKWQNPLFRITMFSGPVIVGALALMGELPRCYTAVYAVLPLTHRAVREAGSRGFVSNEDLPRVLVALLAYLGVLTLCRGYEYGWFS